jgi:acetyl-CoA C-acetyltransferase
MQDVFVLSGVRTPIGKYGGGLAAVPPLGRLVAYAHAGVEPRIMGIGPVPAIRKVLERAGLKLDDIDLFDRI